MSNTIEVGGRFGVEIKDKDGNIVHEQKSKNTVVNAGVKQIKRWLDREEYISDVPINYLSDYKAIDYFAGEERRITIHGGADFTGTYYRENTGFYEDKMYDNNSYTYSYQWQGQNETTYHYIYLDDVINLKKVGIIGYGRSDYWGNASTQEWIQIRQECFDYEYI